jgi:antitoxin VapB
MEFEVVSIEDVAGMQSIKIPEKLKIDDDKVYLKKVGNALYIIPFYNPWQGLIESTQSFSKDFMNDRMQQQIQNRESLDL